MSLEHYFRDELAFLRLQGREFADAYPELTRFLSEQNTDPDVERLLEGFAFLTGNLRAKIEDEFPELTHGLLNMLWPNYLRPVPSMTIMQFSVIPGAIAQPALVRQGCQLDSLPLDEVTCHFQTCHDTGSIRPISVISPPRAATISPPSRWISPCMLLCRSASCSWTSCASSLVATATPLMSSTSGSPISSPISSWR